MVPLNLNLVTTDPLLCLDIVDVTFSRICLVCITFILQNQACSLFSTILSGSRVQKWHLLNRSQMVVVCSISTCIMFISWLRLLWLRPFLDLLLIICICRRWILAYCRTNADFVLRCKLLIQYLMLLDYLLIQEILHVWRPCPVQRLLLLDALNLHWIQHMTAIDIWLECWIILQ